MKKIIIVLIMLLGFTFQACNEQHHKKERVKKYTMKVRPMKNHQGYYAHNDQTDEWIYWYLLTSNNSGNTYVSNTYTSTSGGNSSGPAASGVTTAPTGGPGGSPMYSVQVSKEPPTQEQLNEEAPLEQLEVEPESIQNYEELSLEQLEQINELNETTETEPAPEAESESNTSESESGSESSESDASSSDAGDSGGSDGGGDGGGGGGD